MDQRTAETSFELAHILFPPFTFRSIFQINWCPSTVDRNNSPSLPLRRSHQVQLINSVLYNDVCGHFLRIICTTIFSHLCRNMRECKEVSGYTSVWELIISVIFLSQPSKAWWVSFVTQRNTKPCSGRAPPTSPQLEAHKGSSATVKGSFTAA